MRIAVIVTRVLLGLAFLFSGLNSFLQFIPPQLPPGDAGTMINLMLTHGWFHFIGLLYLIGGLLLVIGRYVPVGLVILGPIIVNILLFHVTLFPQGTSVAIVLALIEVFLIYAYRDCFRGIFTAV